MLESNKLLGPEAFTNTTDHFSFPVFIPTAEVALMMLSTRWKVTLRVSLLPATTLARF